MQVPAIFSNPTTLAAIVECINNGGSAMSSVEEIAGYYAWDAATDNLDSDNDCEQLTGTDFEAHLDVLVENGAQFDYSAALDNATQRNANAIACLHSSDR